MKKALSIALALAMCLGLTIPAFAAEVGDTTITDANGVTYQLSNPISKIETREKYTELPSGVDDFKAYVVPEGTTITPLAGNGYSFINTPVGIGLRGAGESDEFALWMVSPGQGMGGFDQDGIVLKSNEEYAFLSEHWNGNGYDRSAAFCITSVGAEEAERPTPTEPVTPAEPVVKTAEPTNDKLYVDGELAVPTAYKIGGSNYFKIRDVAALLNGTDAQFSVDYDNDTRIVYLVTDQSYEKKSSDLAGVPAGSREAISTNDSTYVNGEKVELTVYKIGGSNYYKLRDLGKALGFNVGYTNGYGAFIETDKPYEG